MPGLFDFIKDYLPAGGDAGGGMGGDMVNGQQLTPMEPQTAALPMPAAPPQSNVPGMTPTPQLQDPSQGLLSKFTPENLSKVAGAFGGQQEFAPPPQMPGLKPMGLGGGRMNPAQFLRR